SGNRVCGTTVAMMAPRISAGSRFSSRMSWVSQTIYSSAVRLPKVEIRQRWRTPASSSRAKTTLVFPASMASSICPLRLSGGGPLCRGSYSDGPGSWKENVAGRDTFSSPVGARDEECARFVDVIETAMDFPVLQTDAHRLPHPGGDFSPGGARNGKPAGSPFLKSRLEGRGQGVEQACGIPLPAFLRKRGCGIFHVQGCVGHIDADPDYDPVPRPFALQQDAGYLAPPHQDVVRPFAAHLGRGA